MFRSLSRRLRLLNRCPVLFLLHSQRRQCNSTDSNEFLFDEDKAERKYHIYQHTANSKTVCLGVTSNCNDKTLSLAQTVKIGVVTLLKDNIVKWKLFWVL